MKTAWLEYLPLNAYRRSLWRTGRALYMKARKESSKAIDSNGEKMMQHALISQFMHEHQNLVVFDVGANVGEWALSLMDEAAKLGASEKIELHCFEPIESTFQTLEKTLEAYRDRGLIKLRKFALSSAEGSSSMFFLGENRGTNSLHSEPSCRDTRPVTVSKTTADLYSREAKVDIIHYLKVDTEGHDFAVISGCETLIKEGRVLVLQFEYNHRWVYSRHFLKDVFDHALGTAYAVGKITASGVEIYEKWHPELERFFEANYVMIRRDVLGRFPHRILTLDASNTFA